MSTLIDDLHGLLADMQTALIENDADRVRTLTHRQISCLAEIRAAAEQDDNIRNELRQKLPEIQKLVAINERLLTQGLELTNQLVRKLYRVESDKPLLTYTRTGHRKL